MAVHPPPRFEASSTGRPRLRVAGTLTALAVLAVATGSLVMLVEIDEEPRSQASSPHAPSGTPAVAPPAAPSESSVEVRVRTAEATANTARDELNRARDAGSLTPAQETQFADRLRALGGPPAPRPEPTVDERSL